LFESAISPEGQICLGGEILEMPVILFLAMINSCWKQAKNITDVYRIQFVGYAAYVKYVQYVKYVIYVLYCLELLHTAKKQLQ
jgi:hypothetical protein